MIDPRITKRTAEPYVKIPISVLHDPELTDRAVRLYAVLVDMQGRNTHSWPLRSTLAAALGCSVSTLKRELGSLTRAGVLSIRHRYGVDGVQISSAYTVQQSTRVTGDPLPSSPVTPPPVHGRPTEPEPGNQNQGTTVLGFALSSHQYADQVADDHVDVSAQLASVRAAIRR